MDGTEQDVLENETHYWQSVGQQEVDSIRNQESQCFHRILDMVVVTLKAMSLHEWLT